MKWDDIKVFIAVAEAGSTLAASRVLGINQTTVSRRIDALERDTGLTLFHRDLSGYRLTAAAEELFVVSRPALAVFQKIQGKVDDLARRDAEHIRLTGPAETINHWVYPILNRFRQKHPDLVMEVDTTDTQVDLHSGDFDLAVRLSDEIDDDRLIARRIASIPWGVYCSRTYEGQRGAPRSIEDAQGHDIVHYADRVASRVAPIRWIGQRIDERQITLRVSSVQGMVTALRTENAIGLLPKVVGDSTPELVPCFRDAALKHNCWVVASPESYMRPLVRACMKQIADEFPRDGL